MISLYTQIRINQISGNNFMDIPIASVIKYEGDNETFIWKHPTEDFNTGTQLIVHESQEAVFFMNGQALDSFGPGRYTLETQNIPLISKIFNLVTGRQSPFHCEVYFINKTEQMAIKWGTDTKMEYVEPTYGFPLQIGACGEMNVRIDDGRKLLIKVVGTENYFDQSDLVRSFRSFLMLKLKPYLVTFIRENKVNIFQIDEHLATLSAAMKEQLQEDFSDYGISLERFFINTVMKPENDPAFRRFKDLHFRQYADIAEAKLEQQLGIIEQQTAAQRTIIEAQALAQKLSIEGYTYLQERQFDVAEGFAGNEGVGAFSNMGVGLGMISAVGNVVGNQLSGVVNEAVTSSAPESAADMKCSACGKMIPGGSKFCPECGGKTLPADSVICPGCGSAVKLSKFCPECGTPLVRKCKSCNHELASGAKFCPECGIKAE